MVMPQRITLWEAGPRDGLQNEPVTISTAGKLQLLELLVDSGLRRFEITSFVHPARVPQLADAAEVARGAPTLPEGSYAALIPNEKGYERAAAAGLKEVSFVLSVSETHNVRNVQCGVEESLAKLAAIAGRAAGAGVAVRAGMACSFGCPFEGEIPDERVLYIAGRVREAGVREIVLADTRGLGLANVLAALQAGVTVFDASVGGMGGCPFAPGASGNIATEDLVSMLHGMHVATGVNLEALLKAAFFTAELTGRPLAGHAAGAAKCGDVHR
jgi:hydroxymethylglutaryl-CoA lyase